MARPPISPGSRPIRVVADDSVQRAFDALHRRLVELESRSDLSGTIASAIRHITGSSSSVTGSGLTSVAHDSTLTGSGTALSPLGVVGGGVRVLNDWFGLGGDGALTFDGTGSVLGVSPSAGVYALASDVMATDVTVTNGVTVRTNGYRMFATGTFNLITGSFITANGLAGANATTTTAGVGGSAWAGQGFYDPNAPGVSGGLNTSPDVTNLPRGIGISALAASAGGAGGTAFVGGPGSPGANGGICQGGGGGGGGGANIAAAGGTAGGGGAIALTSAQLGDADLSMINKGFGHTRPNNLVFLGMHGSAGGSGAPGGGATSFGGGGSGASGWFVPIFARTLSGSGVVQANGGNGGNGSTDAQAGRGASGGGGGGGGGIVLVAYGTNLGSWSLIALGGVSGSGGTGAGGGGNGGAGGNGGNGIVLRLNLSGDGT